MSLKWFTVARRGDFVHEPGQVPYVRAWEDETAYAARVERETQGLRIVHIEPFDRRFDRGIKIYHVTQDEPA